MLKLAKVADAGRALAIAAKTLDMTPETLSAIVLGYANKILREELSDVVKLERVEESYMRFDDVYMFATDLVAPFNAKLKETLWLRFMEEDLDTLNYNSYNVPVSYVRDTFNSFDPSGNTFRELETKAVTFMPVS